MVDPHQELEMLLRTHDWYWSYSDDRTHYQRGLQREQKIEGLLRAVTPTEAKALWLKHAPAKIPYRGPETVGEAPRGPSFTLSDPHPEDEASVMGYDFAPDGDTVRVTPRYSGYPELEVPEVMEAEKARTLWHRLHNEGWRRQASSERVARAHLRGGVLNPNPLALTPSSKR